jgi:hypothetical protein
MYTKRYQKSPGLPELISLVSGGITGSGIYPGILKKMIAFGCLAAAKHFSFYRSCPDRRQLLRLIRDHDNIPGNRMIRIPNPDYLPNFYITGIVMVREGGSMRENILMAAAIIVFSCVPVIQLFGGF